MDSWSVGVAIDALYEGLKARPALAGQPNLVIYDCWPADDQPLEAIWIADSFNQPTVAGFRGGSRIHYNDDYTLDVFTEVRGPGKKARAVRDRALELNAEVELFVAENTKLTVPSGVSGARIQSSELHQAPVGNARRALVHNILHISGRR